MLQIFIITILIILFCFFIMSLGFIINGKEMRGTCGNSVDNPCDCSLTDKLKCSIKNK
jgi:hypothetical protein